MATRDIGPPKYIQSPNDRIQTFHTLYSTTSNSIGSFLGRFAQAAILTLGPLIGTDSSSGVEDIVRVILGLDLTQGIIVGTVEDLFEVGLLEVTLPKR